MIISTNVKWLGIDAGNDWDKSITTEHKANHVQTISGISRQFQEHLVVPIYMYM